MKVNSVLFVCLGNICRSPLAEGIARRLSDENSWNLKIDSCGTSSSHRGEAPDSRSMAIAKDNGIDISSQKSRPVNLYEDCNFDLIIAMDSQNKNDLLKLGFDSKKVFKLGDFGLGEDVPDPYYYRDDEGFAKVFNLIESLLKKMFDKYGFKFI